MRIYVVRHGETTWNKEEVFRGRKDIPLNEAGKKQAKLTGRYFADKNIGKVFASPLRRAVETAEGISSSTGIPTETVAELIDMDFGIWEGLDLREVERLYPDELSMWKKTPHKFLPKGGEGLADVRERFRRGLTRILSFETAPVVLVTHRVVCKIAVLHALEIQNSHFWGIRCDPASITLIEKTKDRLTLSFLNDTCHLRGKDNLYLRKDF